MQQMQAASPKPTILYDNVMVDLETLGTQADAAILSIGAVRFTLAGDIDDKCFYMACTLDSQQRHVSHDTLAWWMGQSAEAKKVFDDPNRVALVTALEDLYVFFGPSYMGRVWSNGADFDIPILTHAYRQMGFDTQPWKFYNSRCFRTMKEEYKGCPKPPFEGVQHNALTDAIHQTKWLLDIERFKQAPAKGFAAVK
jgi:hypothetical protein